MATKYCTRISPGMILRRGACAESAELIALPAPDSRTARPELDMSAKRDLGRARVVELPKEETERRWNLTTVQWPIMHAVTYGITRDQLMARHKANHIQVAYANSAAEADQALFAKAAMADELGLKVSICGTNADGKPWPK